MNGVRHPTLKEVVKAQVATLFGKFRPAGGLSEDEISAIRAERVEFSERLYLLTQAIDAPEAAIIQEIRRITREVYNDHGRGTLPSVEMLSTRVKTAFRPKDRPICFGCEEMGGHYLHAGAEEILQRKVVGEIEVGGRGWLCLAHHHALLWYAQREARRRGIPSLSGSPRVFVYAPPEELLPRGAKPSRWPEDDVLWASWTDGRNMGPLAEWARAWTKKEYGWEVGETETPLLDESVERLPETDAWDAL